MNLKKDGVSSYYGIIELIDSFPRLFSSFFLSYVYKLYFNYVNTNIIFRVLGLVDFFFVCV